MAAGQVITAAQLVDEQTAFGAGLVSHIGQLEDAVDHRVLGGIAWPFAVVSRNTVQSCRAACACSSWMNFLNSVSDAARSSAATNPSRIIISALPRRNLASEQSHKPREPFGLQNAETADIGDQLRQLRPVEEPHRAEVQEHPGVALAQQRDVKRPATRGGVMEADLIAKGRLTRPRQALEDMNPALGETAAQDDVEARAPRSGSVRSPARSCRCVARRLGGRHGQRNRE